MFFIYATKQDQPSHSCQGNQTKQGAISTLASRKMIVHRIGRIALSAPEPIPQKSKSGIQTANAPPPLCGNFFSKPGLLSGREGARCPIGVAARPANDGGHSQNPDLRAINNCQAADQCDRFVNHNKIGLRRNRSLVNPIKRLNPLAKRPPA